MADRHLEQNKKMAQERPADHDSSAGDSITQWAVRESGGESEPTKPVELAIYVAQHCFNCVYARELAALIRQEFPHVKLSVIDVAEPQAGVPVQVFATPTYLLNGKTWFLGNPSPEQVRMKLSQGEPTL